MDVAAPLEIMRVHHAAVNACRTRSSGPDMTPLGRADYGTGRVERASFREDFGESIGDVGSSS